MNIERKFKNGFIFLIGFCILLSGCIQLRKSYPEITTYSLVTERETHISYSGPQVSVRLEPVTIVSEFADRFFTYRTGETTYESDFYNQFAALPSAIIGNLFRSSLKNSPLVQYVVDSNLVARPQYLVNGKILELYGDYRQASQPKAVLRLELTVIDMRGKESAILFQKTYSQNVSISRTSPKALVSGWGNGFGRIMAEFETDLKTILKI